MQNVKLVLKSHAFSRFRASKSWSDSLRSSVVIVADKYAGSKFNPWVFCQLNPSIYFAVESKPLYKSINNLSQNQMFAGLEPDSNNGVYLSGSCDVSSGWRIFGRSLQYLDETRRSRRLQWWGICGLGHGTRNRQMGHTSTQPTKLHPRSENRYL